jgi:hypothetical protein
MGIRHLAGLIVLLAAPTFGLADTLIIEGIENAASERPARGMTKGTVENRFGAPSVRRAAVGEPPISRWEYPGFVVFFEYDRVIHTVVKRGSS